jgi:hypothetical protein
MKLNIVPARTGIQWVKSGVMTFFKQPLAMAGLFFMFLASITILSIVPVIGSVLALCLLPAATLGLIAATEIAVKGKFPMPSVMLTAFRAGKPRATAMWVLGGLYAAGFVAMIAITALFDDGQFATAYLGGGGMSREQVMQADFQSAVWIAMALYLPLSMAFWHAPALVHWQGVAPVKSLFFSFFACLKNFRAFAVYGFVWLGLFIGVGMALTTVAALIGGPTAAAAAIFPAAMLMAAMFFTSIYFTIKDCFDTSEGTPS